MGKTIIRVETFARTIFLLRDQFVLIDSDLATLYPKLEILRFQSGISSWGGRRYRLYASTEEGVARKAPAL